jgi:hypothetical protein
MTLSYPLHKPDPTIKWAARLSHVREVSLLGTADLACWAARLEPEGLRPAERDGRAQVLIIAADARFMGVRFREVSVSVLVSEASGERGRDAAYLVHAFNSSRFFAFCERRLFSTPYSHADVGVNADAPTSIRVAESGREVFRAAMAPGRTAARDADGGWSGPVFLPKRAGAAPGDGRLFFARLLGRTETYSFLAGKDSVAITPGRADGALRSLLDSQFVGNEWTVRRDATHAKSKTYARADALAIGSSEAMFATRNAPRS